MSLGSLGSSDGVEATRRYPPRRCFCNYGHCANRSCTAESDAACFHAVRLAEDGWGGWDPDLNAADHLYGCLPKEAGGSMMQCNGHRATHARPKSIACCFNGDECNLNLQPPPANLPPASSWIESPRGVIVLGCAAVGVVAALLLILFLYFRLCRRDSKRWLRKLRKREAVRGLRESEEGKVPLTMEETSGSGSASAPIAKRTMKMDVEEYETIGHGRYGEVRKGRYKGDWIAVKIFETFEEASWSNEVEIYGHISHDNILRFRNADIGSEDSVTKKYIYSDYHARGSLYDYLNKSAVSTVEAVRLLHSAISGLSYLHNAENGKKAKPAIAHRDIKTKNILVKSPGVTCIADFGLAVMARADFCAPSESPDKRVGTKRYMAPEVLELKMLGGFEAYPRADMYAFALVMWEVLRRVEEPLGSEDTPLVHAPAAVLLAHPPHLLDSRSSGIGGSLGSSGGSGGGGFPHQPPALLPTSALPAPSPLHTDEGISSGSSSGSSGPARPGQMISAKQYLCPFGDLEPNDPSFERMRDIVVTQRKRPEVDPAWRQRPPLAEVTRLMETCWDHTPERKRPEVDPAWRQRLPLAEVARLMETCWDHTPEARLSALRVKKDLDLKVLKSDAFDSASGSVSDNGKVYKMTTSNFV